MEGLYLLGFFPLALLAVSVGFQIWLLLAPRWLRLGLAIFAFAASADAFIAILLIVPRAGKAFDLAMKEEFEIHGRIL